MDAVIDILNKLAPLVGILVGSGLLVKYLPFMRKVSNTLIPLLNALIVFFGAFGGAAPAPAHAGIFGDIGNTLGFGGKAVASLFLSATVSWLYDRHLNPILGKLQEKGILVKPT